MSKDELRAGHGGWPTQPNPVLGDQHAGDIGPMGEAFDDGAGSDDLVGASA